MADLTLTLDQALALAINEAAVTHVRVLGLLAAAAILTHRQMESVPSDTAEVLVGLCESVAEGVYAKEEERSDG